ncbi:MULTISPECIES: anti-sigma factor family protein [unclassified Streptomyces]|uniref:anti-sigma factor family protein n=1 Tax=unclassified Streptomyces TaxID=2593676 RepID=UPI002E2D2D6A|nr:hypothetical protein [Streptomyces sp. NBC_00223]
MTSTTGKDPHPEVAEISDLSEGLLPPDRVAEVRDHLAGCDLCADVLTSLEEIRGLLGTLPGPRRMPADVAGRIDAALAAAALLDATRPDVPRETSPAPVPVPRGTSTAPDGHPGGAKGPGRGGAAGNRPGGGRRRRGVLTAVSAVAVLLLGGVLYQAASSGGGTATTANSDAVRKADGAAVTDPVGNQVRRLLAGPESPPGTLGTGKVSGHADTPMLSRNGIGTAPGSSGATAAVPVPSCVLKATQRAQTPLAAQRELYQGTESYLVVLPHPGDDGLVDAFVVNASCTPAAPGAVLFQDTYPR